MAATIPILIVGAGPTGLNLASLLSNYGIDYRLIEHKTEATHTSNALAIQPRSLEMWGSMGLVENALARGKKILGISLHNATQFIGQINLASIGLETSFPFILGLPQNESEALLTEHLIKNGKEVERGCTLLDVIQTEKIVSAQLQHPDGETETVNCDWLVAADGGHSTIRKKLNLDFAGATIPEKFIMMDAEISADFNPDFFHAIFSPLGPLVFAPLRHFTRIICTVTHDAGINDFTNPAISDFEYVIKERSRVPVKIMKTLWLSHFVTHHRLISNYRQGRILFAGDSAHIHSPVGGQGMNTGIQDTFNLAWKLALIYKNRSSQKLLDTYDIERRDVAKKVLARTTSMTQLVALKNPLLISLRNHILSFILQIQSFKKAFATQISEIGIQYLSNRIIINNGKRAPNVSLLDSMNQAIQLHELLTGLKHKILIFTGKNIPAALIKEIMALDSWINKMPNDLCEGIIISSTKHNFNNKITYFDESLLAHKVYSLVQGGICLIRPDQYIGLSQAQINHHAIEKYMLAISQ